MMIIDVHQAALVISRLLKTSELTEGGWKETGLEKETVETIELAKDFLTQYGGTSAVGQPSPLTFS